MEIEEKFFNLRLIVRTLKENFFNFFMILIMAISSYDLSHSRKELVEIKKFLEELKAQKWSNFFTYENFSKWGFKGFLFLFLLLALKILVGATLLMTFQLILLRLPFFKALVHK